MNATQDPQNLQTLNEIIKEQLEEEKSSKSKMLKVFLQKKNLEES